MSKKEAAAVVLPKLAHSRPNIHVLLYGYSSAGKSTLAATFPQPLYVCCFDGRSKAGPYHRLGNAVESTQLEGGVPVDLVWKDDTLVAEIRYYHDLDPENPNAWRQFREDQHSFKASDWGTWVGDSLTAASLAARLEQQYVINPNSKQAMQWHAGATDQLELQFLRRVTGYTCNVITVCHVAEKDVVIPAMGQQPARKIDKRVESPFEDEEGRVVVMRGLSAPGRLSAKGALMSQYGEVYRAFATRTKEGRVVRALQTQPDDEWVATTQIDAPDPCASNYEALWENWDRR